MSIYQGKVVDGVAKVFKDGVILSPSKSLKVRNHSPDGFEWGYGGSGPSQTALALLLEEFSREKAEQFYESFKQDIIAKFPQGSEWTLTSLDIQAWMTKTLLGREGR